MHFAFSAQVCSWDLDAQWVELDRSRACWQDQNHWRFAQRLLWNGGDHHPAGSTTQEGTCYQPFAEQVLLHSPTRASHYQGNRAPDIWGQGWHRWHSGQQDEPGFGWQRSRHQDWTICWVPELIQSGGQCRDQGGQKVWGYHRSLQGSQGYAPEPWQGHDLRNDLATSKLEISSDMDQAKAKALCQKLTDWKEKGSQHLDGLKALKRRIQALLEG